MFSPTEKCCIILAHSNFVFTENPFFVMMEIQCLGQELFIGIKSGNWKDAHRNAAHFFRVDEDVHSLNRLVQFLQTKSCCWKWQSKPKSRTNIKVATCCQNVPQKQEPPGSSVGGIHSLWSPNVYTKLHFLAAVHARACLNLDSALIRPRTPSTAPYCRHEQQPESPRTGLQSLSPLHSVQQNFMTYTLTWI